MKIVLNEDKELNEKLNYNLKTYGERYCPNKERKECNICPCDNFLNQKELGKCQCGRYEIIEL